MSAIVDKFLKLDCAGDVLNVVGPIKTLALVRAQTAKRRVAPMAFRHPDRYTVSVIGKDALAIGTLIAHTLPVAGVTVFSEKPVPAGIERVKKLAYVQRNTADTVTDWLMTVAQKPTILVCMELAGEDAGIAQVFFNDILSGGQIEHLVLFPSGKRMARALRMAYVEGMLSTVADVHCRDGVNGGGCIVVHKPDAARLVMTIRPDEAVFSEEPEDVLSGESLSSGMDETASLPEDMTEVGM